ncbi:hypothetical protein OG689_44355 [Kitasatospora sp. NBC_00240]|uniref:hypothetical protein n=1 Tax=Kitasatospora sp. NBC_00240 TaxID=2903567 RepID=UPI00225A1491|nr:hypothetical protein [Kitasatospora sp. NBC_00240]MCX5216171.1 hypothetical protein [Kitasatospora sp. NBC_00240]
MQTQWVYQLRDRPGTADVDLLDQGRGRPRQTLARQREGADGLVDGYVLQRIDAQLHTALYSWVLSSAPDPVSHYLLEFLTEDRPQQSPW